MKGNDAVNVSQHAEASNPLLEWAWVDFIDFAFSDTAHRQAFEAETSYCLHVAMTPIEAPGAAAEAAPLTDVAILDRYRQRAARRAA